MSTTDSMIRRIEEECDVPDAWQVFKTGPIGTIELSDFESEGLEEESLELINGDTIAEVVMYHANMAGLPSAQTKGGLDALDEPATDIPSQTGVLQFDDVDDAIEAIDQLADPDVLAEITEYRSPLEADNPLSVREAVAEATDIDMSTVDGTLTSI